MRKSVDRSKLLPTLGIQFNEDKQEQGKSPEGRTSVAEKGKWNANNRHDAQGHSNVHDQVKE